MFENDASDAIDSHQLLGLLPQKYPFLFVDRILSITENKFIIGIKNVSLNEPYFQGHFPDYPVMPNSLIIEGLTQTGSILFLQMPTHSGKFSSFQQIKKMEFFGSVFPGDQVRYEGSHDEPLLSPAEDSEVEDYDQHCGSSSFWGQ